MPRFPAVFLDRDGVIIENRVNCVRSWDEVRYLPRVLGALRRLSTVPYRIITITVQSAVARGILTIEDAKSISDMIVTVIEREGGHIGAVYTGTHAPGD